MPAAVIVAAGESPSAAVPELEALRIADDVLAIVPAAFARANGVLPLRRDNDRLHVAVAEGNETESCEAIEQICGMGLLVATWPPEILKAAIQRVYSESHAADSGSGVAETASAGYASVDDAPVIRLVRNFVVEAVRSRASDIHVEPLETRLRVRYRIDGSLVEVTGLAKDLHPSIISRLKIMANISIAEKRIPQDGRIQMTVDGRQLDLRVASLPTTHGESIVMRILDQEGVRPGLAELGLAPDDAREFGRLLRLPDGIVLVTGPTGSGKTTTLYSCLHSINQRERKIITVEDPVEYQLNGINQVPVRPDVGMTFAAALRTMLRQSPNIVMVGEIRDYETAEMAIHASLTGHMVFSTLHTNDAPGTVTRLVDLGVKPFLVSSALRASVAQRLVRKICQRCQRPVSPSTSELAALGISAELAAVAKFARGEGCEACHGTGYRGRTGIFEIFVINDALRTLIHERAGIAELREKARSQGMRTLREDGIRKVTAGLTTVEEVVSLTVADSS
jgi:type IV pilus assembly protein PilB